MRAGSVTALLVAAPLVLATVLAARLALESLAPAWIAALGLATATATFLYVRARREREAKFGGAVALATLVLLIAIPELGLRSAGFRRVSGVEFGYPSPTDFLELEPEPELFWTLPRDVEGTNSLGFAGPEPQVPKREGSWRALFLGDSCLWQGHPREWPALGVEQLARGSARALECVNLSLAGYSSLQGLRVAERYAVGLQPDLVVVSYGWNDHWLARGSVDASKTIDARFERLFRSSRLVQALVSLAGTSGERVLDVPRVSLEEYDANLGRIVRLFQARGIPVLLVPRLRCTTCEFRSTC
ncbi:MAG: SGNH/GDSL hydrolase family protein [Planctomycetota bacterium]